MALSAKHTGVRFAAALGLLVAPLGATPARADPLSLASFSATVWTVPEWASSPALLELAGPGLAFSGETSREVQPGQQLSPCYPRRCTLGTVLDFADLTETFDFQAHDGTITLEVIYTQ